MKRFLHFLVYNNTIPLIFGVLFLGAGATFAASPEARDTIVNSTSAVTSIDNSYLLNTTITDATVGIIVGSVTENSETYFVEYQLSTIEPRDGAWQPVTNIKTLQVDKEAVGGRDLGLYVQEELQEVHTAVVRTLKEMQERERLAGLVPKTVTTEYNGLVGRFLDPETEVFSGYEPVIPPPQSVPLTPAERRAYEADQKRIADESNTAKFVTDSGEEVVVPPIGGDTGGESSPEEENPPTTDPLPEEITPPEPTTSPPEPTETPPTAPEEPTPTLEDIGL